MREVLINNLEVVFSSYHQSNNLNKKRSNHRQLIPGQTFIRYTQFQCGFPYEGPVGIMLHTFGIIIDPYHSGV